MPPLHQLYFDMVHKMITPQKERHIKANYLDVTLMELLDTEVNINLPSLILKQMQRGLIKDHQKVHVPYGFWFSSIFKDYFVFVQVWSLLKTKDILGRLNYVALPVSVRQAGILIQRLRNELVDTLAELEEDHATHAQYNEAL